MHRLRLIVWQVPPEHDDDELLPKRHIQARLFMDFLLAGGMPGINLTSDSVRQICRSFFLLMHQSDFCVVRQEVQMLPCLASRRALVPCQKPCAWP